MKNKKRTRSYAKRYGGALRGVPTLKEKELAIKTKDGLNKVHPLDVKYEGYTFGTLVDLYQKEVQRNEELRNEIKGTSDALISTLCRKGYNTPNVELKPLVDDISKLLIIEPNNRYFNFILNSNGYVSGKQDVQVIVQDNIQVPDDFDKGYYKIIDGEFVLDEELYRQIWSV